MSAKGKIFNAEISKGYIIKVIIDSLSGPLQRAYFTIDKDGIRLRQSDMGNTVFYNIDLPRKHFKNYICKTPQVISVNLKHFQGQLRNVKKKDSIVLFIDSMKIGKFSIQIRPDGAKKNARVETNSIVYQEETNYELPPLFDGGYEYPMVIEATDFQKIKRLTQIGKIINVVIQKDNFLSFTCDSGVVYDSELAFGELRDGSEDRDICKKCGENIQENCYCECEKCHQYYCECYCECAECKEYKVYCTCNQESNFETFNAEYYSNILTKLVKLPGLCTQMQFYAPQHPGFPLKIEVNAGQASFTLGTIQVFIKDVRQIAHEESLKNEEETAAVEKPKTKSKKKKVEKEA